MRAAMIFVLGSALATAAPALSQEQGELRPVGSFSSISDEAARSAALFAEMGKVISHPRCMNCHPRDDTPRQGDAMRVHKPRVVRHDEAGFGAPGMRCTTCHTSKNVPFVGSSGSIPGNEVWHLAPITMGWIGAPLGAICRQIKDPQTNGDRSLDEIVEHMASDPLVGWAWNPGEGRQAAPGTQDVFGELARAWVASGAHCPQG